MKDQARIQLRTRRVAKVGRPESETNKKLKSVDLPVAAFKPYEVIKPELQPITKERRSTRIATKELTQTVLPFQSQEKKAEVKRKSTNLQKENSKKQKTMHILENTTVETTLIENSTSTESSTENDKDEIQAPIEKTETDIIKETITDKVTDSVDIKETPTVEQVETVKEAATITDPKIPMKEETVAENTSESDTPVDYQDTPSPPSSLLPEPLTPPVHSIPESSQTTSAPYKTYMTEADKERIEYERATLTRLRKALDIVIPDRSARNVPCFYHQIEQSLRNSTRRNISLSHICQIMYVVPTFYSLEPTEIRHFGGKTIEAYKLDFGTEEAPTTGKDFEVRAQLLEAAISKYFTDHPEFDATIPQVPLPRLKSVVDKKEWIQKAQLPPGVRAIMEAHEANRNAEAKKNEPKPKPTGSVKDRMEALRARLASKKKP